MNFNFSLGASNSFTPNKYTIRDIIFRRFPHRKETSTVIIGHQNEELIAIKISELRSLICQLGEIIKAKKLLPGDTVMLASFYSSNELANAILFSAFACLGIRVFIPIYPEVEAFEEWHELTNFKSVIIPYKEILQQKGLDREKEVINSFASLCQKKQISFLDAYQDFDIPILLQKIKYNGPEQLQCPLFKEHISTEDEAVIFTTSGTSGKSKLVVYNQGAFSLSCQSWQEAGLFDPAVCGNTGFTPLFTHTIGIRNYINALWTGYPVCILVINWFLNKPEEAKYLLQSMRPGHIIGGPALFNMLIEFFRQFPELKTSLKKDLKTIISIGAEYNLSTARQLETALGIKLWNAFGTTETQMVLLNRPEKNGNFNHESLGFPLPGVEVGLKKTNNKGIYELNIRSSYQSAHVLNESSNDLYFISGDLVSFNENKNILLYSHRKGSDFIKDEFGVKIPIKFLHEYYS